MKKTPWLLLGPVIGVVFGIVGLLCAPLYWQDRSQAMNILEWERTLRCFGSLKQDTQKEIEAKILIVNQKGIENARKEAKEVYTWLNDKTGSSFKYYYYKRQYPIGWAIQNWVVATIILLVPSLIGLIVGFAVDTINKEPEILKGAVREIVPKVATSIAMETARQTIHQCPAYSDPQLAKKIIDAMDEHLGKTHIDTVQRFLNQVRGDEDLNAYPGAVLVVPNATIRQYASLARTLDEIVVALEGTIYSTNIIVPNHFAEEEAIRRHISTANELLSVKTGSEPKLLRLQLVTKHSGDKSLLVNKEWFLDNVSTNMEKKWQYYRDNYIKEGCTFLVDTTSAEIGKRNNIVGDYIVYDNSFVLKWDEWEKKVGCLYLLFGNEVIRLHSRIFEQFISKYGEYKNTKEYNNPIIDLYSWTS